MGHPTPSQQTHAPRSSADWRRAAAGIELAGISVFLLLNSTGVLPWSFWLDALRLWPVLIMSAGVRIAFERSRMPWLLLLGPVLILGALAWVARGMPPEEGPAKWTALSAERPDEIRAVRFEATLPGARIDLVTRPLASGLLVEGRSASRRETALIVTGREGGTGRAVVRAVRVRDRAFLAGVSDRWDLALPSDLPVAVTLGGAIVRGHLDLSAGPVEGASAKGVFLGLDLRLPRPERTVDIRVGGVFNVVSLFVPEGTPVRVRGAGLPFNVRDRTTNGTPSAEKPGYEVRLRGIFNVLTVATSPGQPTPEAEPGRDGSIG